MSIDSHKHRPEGVSLRAKVTFILLVAWAIYGLISYTIQLTVIYPSFLELERNEVRKNMLRLDHVIDRETYHIQKLCNDWASWDATHDYAATGDQDFVTRNMDIATFKNACINLICVLDTQGNVVGQRIYDSALQNRIQLREFPSDRFPQNHPILTGLSKPPDLRQSVSGLMRTDEGILFFAARSILTSRDRGPSHGTLIMGRFLCNCVREAIADQTETPFHLAALDDKRGALEQMGDEPGIPLDATTYMWPRPATKSLEAKSILFDFTGKPAGIITAHFQAAISEQGRRTLRYAQVSAVFSLVGIMVVILWTMNRSVIRPILDLTHHIMHTSRTDDLIAPMETRRKDEIGMLTKQYNRMILELNEKRQKLQQMAITDKLTGLFNHAYILQRLNYETLRASRYGGGLAIVMFDLDYFKRVNDTRGHVYGDHVLSTVCAIMAGTLRTSDLVGRYGGEEFLAILPHQSAEGAYIAAERVRKAIEMANWGDAEFRITVSAGIAVYGKEDPQQLLEEADRNLYRAKHNGRNRTEPAAYALSGGATPPRQIPPPCLQA